MRKFKVLTFGCKSNKFDSAIIENGLGSHAELTPVSGNQIPDFIVVNTCTVTESSDSQARKLINSLRRNYPLAKIFVSGCLARVNPAKAGQSSTQDTVIESFEPLKVVSIIKTVLGLDNGKTSDIKPKLLKGFPGRTRAFLKVQDGCDSFCTYCIIPFARGKPKSLALNDVLAQMDEFAKSGLKEVVLTGIHLGMYGKDIHGGKDLLGLLRILEEKSKIERIRLSSIEPDEISEELIRFIYESKKINWHLHLPMQSGSDGILHKMGRKYCAAYFRDIIFKIKSTIKNCGIGIDIISGFPSESDSDHESTYRLVQEIPVSYVHVFPFSPRKGTKAFDMGGKINPVIIKKRCASLRGLGEEKKILFRKSLLGSIQTVLIEGKPDAETGFARGFTRNYVPVIVDGCNCEDHRNLQLKVKIERLNGNRISGKVYEENT